MKYLTIPETYEKDGEKKTTWNRVGYIFQAKDGREYVKLYHIPGALIHIYEQKKKESEDFDFNA